MLHALDWDDDESVTLPQGEIPPGMRPFAPTITILGMPAVEEGRDDAPSKASRAGSAVEPALDWDDEAEITLAQEQALAVQLPPPKLPPRRRRPSTPPVARRGGEASDAEATGEAPCRSGAEVVVSPIIDVAGPPVDHDPLRERAADEHVGNEREGYDTIVDECVPFGLRHDEQRAAEGPLGGDTLLDFAASLRSEPAQLEGPDRPREATPPEPAPATSPSARAVDVDLGALEDAGPSSAGIHPPIIEDDLDDEQAMTPLPRGYRPGELRGSVPPVALSDLPPTAARRGRLGLIASAGAALACLAVFALLLYPRTGSLTVRLRTADGSPASRAEIYVDGTKRCDTDPCIVRALEPGTKTIKVMVPGAQHPRVAHVDVMAGEQSVLWVDLPRRQGIKARSDQDGVRVSVDGIERGLLPIEIGDLTVGEHRLRFSAAGATPLERTVRVESNEVTDLGSIELSKDTPLLTVRRATPGARVVLIAPDGDHHVLRGPWPKQLALEPGAYRLVASCPGYRPFSTRFELGASEPPHQVTVELERAGAAGSPPAAAAPHPAGQPPRAEQLVVADDLDPYED